MSKGFKLIIEQDGDGNIHADGINNGFTAIELIAILELKKRDIIEQLVNPEKFKNIRIAKVDNEYIAIKEKEDSEDTEE